MVRSGKDRLKRNPDSDTLSSMRSSPIRVSPHLVITIKLLVREIRRLVWFMHNDLCKLIIGEIFNPAGCEPEPQNSASFRFAPPGVDPVDDRRWNAAQYGLNSPT